MLYAILAILLLTLPGLSISMLLGLRRMVFLFSVSLSYALFVLTLKVSQLAKYNVQEFTYLYLSLVIALISAAILIHIVLPCCRGAFDLRLLKNQLSSVANYIYGGFAILVVLAVYYLYAGPYLELPSDIFQHMEYVQTINRIIERSYDFSKPLSGFYLQFNGKYWHYFYTLLNHWLELDLVDSISSASFVNNLIFLLGVFSFSTVVFDRLVTDKRMLVLVSLGVCGFTFLQFGVSIFSFIRYYAMAPVMINMVLFFTMMAVTIRFFQDDGWPVKEMLVASVIAFAGLYIHVQEVLFAVVMVLSMSGYLFAREVLGYLRPENNKGGSNSTGVKCYATKPAIVFSLLALSTLALHIFSILTLDRNRVVVPKLVSIGEYLPFGDSWFILNPVFQFYQVLGTWGILTIILFFINWKVFRENTYLVAGMISPVLTLFNPLFVDLFLRHSHSIMLWRLSFLVPVYLVGGYLFVMAIRMLGNGDFLRRVNALTTIILLLVLMLPMKSPLLDLPTSRFQTLAAVGVKNSPEYWSDLLQFIDSVETKRLVITDPVTGYMISALTKHQSPRYKFHRAWGGYINFDLEDFSHHPFDGYAGRLLIINRRSGDVSETGKLGHHWPENILQVEMYYNNKGLDEYIAANPDRFKLLWDRDRVQVYEISAVK